MNGFSFSRPGPPLLFYAILGIFVFFPFCAGISAAQAPPAPTPPPAPDADPRVTAIFRDVSLPSLAKSLEEQTGLRFSLQGKTAQMRVSLVARDLPLSQAMRRICEPGDLLWWRDAGGALTLCDLDYYRATLLADKEAAKALGILCAARRCQSEPLEEGGWRLRLPAAAPATATPAPPEITVVFKSAPVAQILTSLEMQSGCQILARGEAKGARADILAQSVSLEEALNRLCGPYGWEWWRDAATGAYMVADRACRQWSERTQDGFTEDLDAFCHGRALAWSRENDGSFRLAPAPPSSPSPAPAP